MSKTRILVVEDETITGLDIKECLEDFGYAASGPITNGEEAIQTAKSMKPDLILMDIMLQGKLDGITTAQQIRETLGTPVIFLTAYADNSTLSRAKTVEPYGYVLKPFKKVELRTAVELALYRSAMENRRIDTSAGKSETGSSKILDSLLNDLEKHPHTTAQLQSILNFLKNVEPFSHLDANSLKVLSTACPTKLVTAGEYLILEGDEKSMPFLVISGRVALVKTSASGKDLVVELVGPGDAFGLLAALDKKPTPFSARAQIDSSLLLVPSKIVAHILDNSPDISRRLIAKVLERLKKSHDLSRALAHDRVEVRTASALLALLPPKPSSGTWPNDSLEIELTRQELAEMTGTAPETASRVANALERDGLIDLSQLGKVKILDPEGLSDLISI